MAPRERCKAANCVPTGTRSGRTDATRFACGRTAVCSDRIGTLGGGRLHGIRNAPHTAAAVLGSEWRHGYSREQAAFPLAYVAEAKYWPPVARVDNVYGDRNLVCTCAPIAAYAEAAE